MKWNPLEIQPHNSFSGQALPLTHNQSVSQTVSQSVNQSINQSTNQSINHTNALSPTHWLT